VLTKKGKYGLKAMVHLAGLEPGELAQVANIAETNSISKKFLDHILADLRHAGLVYSKKGKGGGYALARPAHEIRVVDRARPRWSTRPDSMCFGHRISPLRRLRRS
jgi:Rrf2 family protein